MNNIIGTIFLGGIGLLSVAYILISGARASKRKEERQEKETNLH
ncbi:hypothetical protein [Neisseria montereyensis]|uniref:Uncharacterized protein n=1 Tax=Neisseria montereyensis TaxID=2973938 RepID=A0ABT2FEP3_9NEIS|nr:hypothetical protein [Neisseria montereyensis]MCS4534623.1 hypothetical protein [Neisseria montereyensis]